MSTEKESGVGKRSASTQPLKPILGGRSHAKGGENPRSTVLELDINNDTPAPVPLWKPHQVSYFVPGKMEGVAVKYLIDTGCTTNLLSKEIFDTLPRITKRQLQPLNSQGKMADGTPLPFSGLIRLKCKVRDVAVEETFVICRINEDAILGMPFLTNHGCSVAFDKALLTIDGKQLACTDRCGNPFSSNIQVRKTVKIPARSEITMTCRIISQCSGKIGIVEGGDRCILASSLNRPDHKRLILVRALNPDEETLELKAGTVVGSFTTVDENQTPLELGLTEQTVPKPTTVPKHLEKVFVCTKETCPAQEQQEQIAAVLNKYADVFSKDEDDIGSTTLVEHEIPTIDGTTPIRQTARRLGPEKEAEVEKQVQKLLKKKLIEPADSAWSAPVVLVRKKDNSWRFCIDYRKLNAVTRHDAYPLPRIDESLDALTGSQLFSTLDLVSGYWQVPLSPDAQDKSAFITRSGLWRKWKVLPFGLTSAPTCFQRLMEQLLHGLHLKSLLLYLDDVIVISPDFETRVTSLSEVLECFRAAGLKLKPEKCELFCQDVKYLGHIPYSLDGKTRAL